MPADHGLRSHDEESLLPSRPDPAGQDPEELIECADSWPRVPAFQCRELLAKSQVFKKQAATRSEEANDHSRQESEGIYHVPVLSYFACGKQCRILLKSQADRILARECVQKRQTCSVGGKPTGVKARSPLAWVASVEETKRMKPTDKAILRMVSKSPGRNESELTGGLETKLRSGGRALSFGAKAAWHGAG